METAQSETSTSKKRGRPRLDEGLYNNIQALFQQLELNRVVEISYGSFPLSAYAIKAGEQYNRCNVETHICHKRIDETTIAFFKLKRKTHA